MKIIRYYTLCILVLGSISSCIKDSCTETRQFIRVDPVIIGEQLYRAQPKSIVPQELIEPGIIYGYKQFLLINERFKGIHVLDNGDPKNPKAVSFIEIPGNEHFAIYKNTLYANQYDALLTLDITDFSNVQLKSRMDGAFGNIWEMSAGQYLAYYRPTKETLELDCADLNFNSQRWQGNNGAIWFDAAVVDFAANTVQLEADQAQSSGIGGSTARFTITKDHLYIADQSQLSAFDLSDICKPDLIYKDHIGWNIETIYPFKSQLFIGSTSGMFIFDISEPGAPIFQSRFDHVRACDPVVADENTAYVTLRDGTFCQGFNNQLDVINVENVYNPSLIRTIEMDNPHGLALSGDLLYVCEGDYGLKVFDVKQRNSIKQIAHYQNFNAKDVIVLSTDRILIIGDDGFIQFDASQPTDLKMISNIQTK